MTSFVGALGVLAFCSPVASAVAPTKQSFDFTDSFVDTEVCAAPPWQFNVSAQEHTYGFFQIFTDKDGNFVRGAVHQSVNFIISANGITLTERDRFTIFFYPDGRREVGLWTHIQGPSGGLVLRDAGQLVFDANGEFVYNRGPHPQFFGASFCPALVP